MAEVGLVPFAHLTLEVAGAVLPPCRTRFSKHQFTQPQLLAILCLMRYEDWTYREAEVRLGEHSELRRALGLRRVPDHTTLYRFLCRLPPEALAAALAAVVRRFPRRGRARVAVDATGLSSGAVSTFFVRRLPHHTHQPLPWRHGLKWLVVVDIDQHLLLAQAACRGPWNDCTHLPVLVGAASHSARIGLVLAEAEFEGGATITYIRQQLGADSVLPARRGKRNWRLRGIRAEMRRAFPARKYGRRPLVESVFSRGKRKLSARAPGRTLFTQQRPALLLGLAFNLYRL